MFKGKIKFTQSFHLDNLNLHDTWKDYYIYGNPTTNRYSVSDELLIAKRWAKETEMGSFGCSIKRDTARQLFADGKIIIIERL